MTDTPDRPRDMPERPNVRPIRPGVTIVPDPGVPWESTLRRSEQHGGILASYRNTTIIVRGLWGAELAINSMREEVEFRGRPITDAIVGQLRCEIDARFWVSAKLEELRSALIQVADERRYHPVQRYLTELPAWDETRRWVGIPGAHFGLDIDSKVAVGSEPPIYCTLLERWAISAVARAFEPGCQVDHVLTLQGREERRKSTFFRALGGQWFGEGDVDTGIEGVRSLSSKWIWCWDELAGMSRKEQANLDGFITRPIDTLRPLYRNPIDHPRTTVLVATAGPSELIQSPTGGRRWWIVPVLRKMADGEIDPHRDQLWAEALHLYRAGLASARKKAIWWLDADSEIASHAAVIDGHRVGSGWDEPIARWLNSPSTLLLLWRDHRRGWITTDDALNALGVEPKDREQRSASTLAGAAIRRCGWVATETRPRIGLLRLSAYAPPAGHPALLAPPRRDDER